MNAKVASPDIEGLEEFVERPDREEPEFFAGRVREIANIESACRYVLRRSRAGRLPSGATRIVQGAPGAGKTSLLHHLARKWAADKKVSDTVLVDLTDFHSAHQLAEIVIQAQNPKRLLEFRRTVTWSGSIEAKPLGIGGGSAGQMATAPPYPSLRVVAEMLPPKKWKRPLLLMIDEAQNLAKPQVDALQPLHLGTHGLPVALALAGLANTREILGKHGMSHIADDGTHTLGALTFEEATEAVKMFLDRFVIDRTGIDIDWPSDLAAAADGWPRHLHNALQALAAGLLAADGQLADVDAEAVRQGVRERRMRSYWDRIENSELAGPKILLAELMQWLPEEGHERHKIVDAMEAIADPSGPSGKRLPEGLTASRFLDRLIAKGALQSNGRGKLVCPIPSFQDFMARGFEMAPSPDLEPKHGRSARGKHVPALIRGE